MARLSSWDRAAREAAERVDAAREMGEQLVLLPEMDADDGAGEAESDGPARRGPGKAQSTLRQFMAAKGYRAPEEMLAELAGMATREDVIVQAMARAEQLVAWQFDGAVRVMPSGTEVPAKPTASARLEAFKLFYSAAVRAAEALLPYGLAKVQADVSVTHNATTIVMPGAAAPARPGDDARVVSGRRMAPPPMPGEIVQDQQFGDDDGE